MKPADWCPHRGSCVVSNAPLHVPAEQDWVGLYLRKFSAAVPRHRATGPAACAPWTFGSQSYLPIRGRPEGIFVVHGTAKLSLSPTICARSYENVNVYRAIPQVAPSIVPEPKLPRAKSKPPSRRPAL